jgi:hypothetical protein
MWCMKCNHDLSECTCPDLLDRLKSATENAPFVFKRCKKCGRYHSQCKCEQPEWEIVGTSLQPAVKELSPKESEAKILSLVMELKGICLECLDGIDNATRERLNATMAKIFESQCDGSGQINIIEMAYMLSNGLSFVLAQLAGSGTNCDDCQNKLKEYSKMVH